MNKTDKKTICLITDWYPTKENPYQGLFFKEQAFAVSNEFNFLVLRYTEKVKQFHLIEIEQDNTEKNTKEYCINVRIPIRVIIADLVHDFYVKRITHRTVDGVGRYISEQHKKYRRRVVKKILSKLGTDSFDVLYCVDAQREAAVLRVFSELTGKPYIIGEHAPVPWPGTVLDDTNKEAIEKATLFLAISHDKIRQLMLLNIKLPEIKYIGNLVDEEQFRLIPEHSEDHIKTLIIIAANSFYKNYDMFFAVMSRLNEITDVPFKVLIVGYGANKGYSKNIEEFEENVREMSFADKVEMIREVPHSQIGEVLNRADAFVMTSIQEGQPVSAMEAACCGLPIFSTRCGGVEDYVDEKMGRIYNLDDIDEMAEDLRDYLSNNMSFDKYYIRDSIKTKFGQKVFLNKFIECFEKGIKDGQLYNTYKSENRMV